MFGEETIIPFHYGVVALVFGVVLGFLMKCYQENDGEHFLRMVYLSAKRFLVMSFSAATLPILVRYSVMYREALMYIVICDAEFAYNSDKNTNVSITDSGRRSLAYEFLRNVSTDALVRFSWRISESYFGNLIFIVNSILQTTAEDLQTDTFNVSEQIETFKIQKRLSADYRISLSKPYYGILSLPCL